MEPPRRRTRRLKPGDKLTPANFSPSPGKNRPGRIMGGCRTDRRGRGILPSREIVRARNVNATSRPVLTWVDDCGCRAKSIVLGESPPRWSRPSPRRRGAWASRNIYMYNVYIHLRDACPYRPLPLLPMFVRRSEMYVHRVFRMYRPSWRRPREHRRVLSESRSNSIR